MRLRTLAFLPILLLSLVLLSCGSGTAGDQTAQTSPGGDTGTSTSGQGGTATNPHGLGRPTTTPPGHADVPTADEIKQDLIDSHSFILDPQTGEWDFDSLPEFASFIIVSQDQTEGQLNYDVDMTLKDTRTGQIFTSQAKILYKQDNGLWVFSGVKGNFKPAQAI